MRPKAIPYALFAAAFAVVAVSGQGAPAFAAPHQPSGKASGLAVERARATDVRGALGLGSSEQLVVKDVITDPDGSTHVRYNRTFNGLRVIGGDLVSHRGASGRINNVSWNAAHTVAVDSTTARVGLLSAEGSGARKAASLRRTTSASTGELVIFSSGPAPKLAYDVLTVGVQADQTPSRLHTIVDADTGAVLNSFDEIQTGTGHGLYVGTVPVGTTAGPPWSMLDAVGNYTTDLGGATSGTGTTFTDADDTWGNGSVSDRASAAVDAQYGASKTFAYFLNVQGRNGIWDNGVGARSRVHYGSAYNNAFWDGTQMTYGDGAGNIRPLVELDVAAHEMTHGVTQQTAGLAYTGDAGGLNEATSDIFGTAVEFYANAAADTPDYLIGEKINLFGNGSPLRYMDKPSRDGHSRDCWSSTLGGLDPHFSSGPLNHWFYLASEGSGAKVINGVSYNSPTCNAATVAPIGREAAAKIWYRTLSTYLTSNSDYAAARDGAIRSARDLYGASSTQCTGVEASFSAIAVPAGAEACGAADTTPIPSTGPGAPTAPTAATATAGNGQAFVSWKAPASNGGSAITGYAVAASLAGLTATTTGTTTATVSGLTNGTSYTFTITATNATGTSLASGPSAAVIPSAVTPLKRADFSGDGKADLQGVTTRGDVYLYRGNGVGGFSGAGTRIGSGWGGFTKVFSPGDFTGDGRSDLVGVTSKGYVYLYRGNGTGGISGAGTRIAVGWGGFAILF